MNARQRITHKSTTLRKKPSAKSYEYQSDDSFMAHMFVKVLRSFGIEPYYDSILPTSIDSSIVKFMATPKERYKIEYIYRRLCNLNRIFVMTDGYMNNRYKYFHDRYYIL